MKMHNCLSMVTLFLCVLHILSCNHHKSINNVELLNDGIITIGIYTDTGAEEACIVAARNMFEWMGCRVKSINANHVKNDAMDDIDIFYFPGGNMYKYMMGISNQGKYKIRQMVASGVGYIGTCAGATFAAERMIWRGDATSDGLLDLFPGTSESPNSKLFTFPDIGMSKVVLMKPHPITDTLSDSMWIFNYNSPFFTVKKNASIDVIAKYPETDQIAIVACSYGNGRVFLTGLHTEWEEDSDRDGISYFDQYEDRGSEWNLMMNAVHWCVRETY